MTSQDVVAEVAGGIAPHRVDVVDVALGVVVFGEKSRSLQSVVVRLPALDASSPRKVDRAQFVTGELLGFPLSKLLRDSTDEDVENCP